MVTTPSTVEVTGPVQQLDQVAKCVAQTDQKLQLSASTTLLSDQLLFYNEKGALLDDSDFTYDDIRYSMEIPVLYQKTLDVTYQITNAPSSFDQSSLDLKLSLDQITLAAPNDSLGDMKEFNIGSVSLSEIGLDFSKDFKLEMPEGFTNESGVNTVTLSLDTGTGFHRSGEKGFCHLGNWTDQCAKFLRFAGINAAADGQRNRACG